MCGTGSFFTFAGFGGGGGVLVNLPDAILCSGVRSAVWFGMVVCFPFGEGFLGGVRDLVNPGAILCPGVRAAV